MVVSLNVTLRNIIAIDTLPLFEGPGVFLCDPTNPCTDITFDNVVNTMWDGNVTEFISQLPINIPNIILPHYHKDEFEYEYIVSNMYGSSIGNVTPSVCLEDDCFWKDETETE